MSRHHTRRPLGRQVALVTGGSRGIGAAIAKRLAADAPASPSLTPKARTPRHPLSKILNAEAEGRSRSRRTPPTRCRPERRERTVTTLGRSTCW